MARSTLKFFALALVASLLVVTLVPPAFADGDELPNFKKMRVKELNKLLKERGVDAKGVAEKSELVQLVQDNYHLPVMEIEETPPSKNPDLEPKKVDDGDLEEMLRKMQAETGQKFKVFKPGDNMDDFIKSQGGAPSGSKWKKDKKNKAHDGEEL